MNLIAIVFKRLKSRKLMVFLRIVTMGVGIGSAMVLFYIALNELTTDNFYPDKNQIYEVFNDFKSPNYSGMDEALVQPLIPAMRTDFPQVEMGTNVFNNGKTNYKSGKSLIEVNTIYADSIFFKVFRRRFVIGIAKRSLKLKNSAVITQKLAVKLFGNSVAAIGKVIYLNQVRPIIITGIIENWPANSSFQADVIISFATLKDEHELYMGWDGGDSFIGFVKLVKGTSPSQIEKAIPDFLRKYYDVDADEAKGFHSTYLLIPLTKATFIVNTGKKMIISIVIFIGLLVFGLVCFNSLLLILAGYVKFMKEISINRTLGASNSDINRFIFCEALIYMIASSGVAFIFLVLIDPFIRFYFDYGITDVLSDDRFWLMFLIIFAIAFFIIYIIPGYWSRRFFTNTQKELSYYKPFLNINLQRALLTLQIGISLILIVFLFFINSQFNFIRHFNIGYDSNNLVYIELSNESLYSKDKVIKSEIAKLPGVISACLSDAIPLWGLSGNSFSNRPDGQNAKIVRNVSVDNTFFSTLKMKTDGPGFGQTVKDNSVMITRKAAKLFQLRNPIGKTLYFWKQPMVIHGVVHDFISGSLHSKMEPTVFSRYINPSVYSVLTVRLASVKTTAIIAKIKKTIQQTVPGQIVQIKFYNTSLQENYHFDKAVKKTVGFFSLLAALITLSGLAGFTLSLINARTKELSIRKINGATSKSLVLLLNKLFIWNIVIAIILFIPFSFELSKIWLQQYAYSVSLSWWIFVSAAMLVSVAVISVISLFTIRAALKNPVDTLRYE